MRIKKLFIYSLFGHFLLLMPKLKAQETRKVTFEDYTTLESDLLKSLKKQERIASLTSMNQLKVNSSNTEENTVVRVKLPKANHKLIKPVELFQQRRSSIMMVCQYIPALKEPEKVESFATCIVLSEDGVCLTNYHVLWKMIDKTAKLNPVDSVMFIATLSGKIYSITSIISYNKKADMALFKIETKGERLVPFPLGNDLPVASNVYTITNPDGYFYNYSKGVVSRNIIKETGNLYTSRTEISADYAKGSSGGPIFDDYGNLVSMVSTTHSIYYTDRPQTNLQMVIKQTIPVSLIMRMIRRER